jgi:hypothetical protein
MISCRLGGVLQLSPTTGINFVRERDRIEQAAKARVSRQEIMARESKDSQYRPTQAISRKAADEAQRLRLESAEKNVEAGEADEAAAGVAPLYCKGIARIPNFETYSMMQFNRRPTDDEMRFIHDKFGQWMRAANTPLREKTATHVVDENNKTETAIRYALDYANKEHELSTTGLTQSDYKMIVHHRLYRRIAFVQTLADTERLVMKYTNNSIDSHYENQKGKPK